MKKLFFKVCFFTFLINFNGLKAADGDFSSEELRFSGFFSRRK